MEKENGNGGQLVEVVTVVATAGGMFLWKAFRFVLYIGLSVLVIPAMLIMVLLHPTWEEWTGEVFQIGV